MSSEISNLTTSSLGSADFIPIARAGDNYKLNLLDSISSVLTDYTIQDFGIVEDGGASDQRTAFQTAIDTIYSAGGGTLNLPEGTFKVNESSGLAILLKTGVKLKGAGKNKTYITTDNTVAAANYCLIAPYGYNTATSPYSAHELEIEDLSLTCSSYANNCYITNSATYSGGTQTLLTVSSSGGVSAGMTVVITGANGASSASYNTTFTVQSVVSSTTFAINLAWPGTATTAGTCAFTVPQRLHNLIGIAHCPRARITRIGFVQAPFHAAEFNLSKNIIVKDCSIEGSGNFNGSVFELDAGGSCGQISSNAKYSTSISNSATYASGTQTLLTVPSTANFNIGDFVIITSANGSSASTYNALGGYRITNIVSSTTMAINLAWPSNATTAGTIKAEPATQDIWIDGFDGSIGRADAGIYTSYEFLYLTHTTQTGIYKNFRLTNSKIRIHTTSYATSNSNYVISLDTAADPIEFTGFEFSNNIFLNGGHTGTTIVMNIADGYSSTYASKQYRDIIISDNIFEGGFKAAIQIGATSSEVAVRTSIALTDTNLFKNISIERNIITPNLRGGTSTFARPSRSVLIGACDKATIRNNRIFFANRAPENLNGLSWTASVSNNYGFLIDHPRDLIFESNEVEVALTANNADIYLFAFAFGASAFELASSGPISGNWIVRNNSAIGTGSIGNGITAGFIEMSTLASTGIAQWSSARSPSISGMWSGNRVVTGGTLSQTLSPTSLPIPLQTFTTSAMTEATAATLGSHWNWWSHNENFQSFSDADVTVLPNTTLLFQTGTMTASRTVTLPYATRGTRIKIIDSSGTVTGSNTLVVTRSGSDTINGSTSITINSGYGKAEIISDKTSKWVQSI